LRREKRRPLLEALKQVEFGQLTLTTPEGERMEFRGTQAGPVADWTVYDWHVFDSMVARGDLGLADSYVAGLWDSDNVEALITFGLMNADRLEHFFHSHGFYAAWLRIRHWMTRNSLNGSRRNVTAHYDLGNEFYKLWLDESMTYSCGLFEGDASRSLEEAQQAKYARILRKINARPGDHILEIGCGWGGFAEAAARQGLDVTGITLASTQAEYARDRMAKAGLSAHVSIKLMDYREVQGVFDHIVSIGMFEHVGEEYWPSYFETIKRHLKPEGNALIQSITIDEVLFNKLHDTHGFIEEYIFPGGTLPSKSRFYSEAKSAKLQCHELYAFGQDYVLTLSHWLTRFEANLSNIKALGYDEEFIRLWRLYLSSCIATFKTRRSDVVQVEITHANSRSEPTSTVPYSELVLRAA
jgi:cyclopropane-fatty-acyl-phospholipid synthase